MEKIFKKNPGTTLVEITLYFAIIGVILMSALVFSLEMMNLTASSQIFAELQTNQDFIVQKITDTIQEANSVNETYSVFDDVNGILSLNMPVSGESPTKFYLEGGNIVMRQGVKDPIRLNSTSITFDSLKFTRIQANKAPDQVMIDSEFTPLNNDLAALDQVFKLHLTVSLRRR